MPHNKKAVKEIVSAYVSGTRRIIYVSGVGTGKSFVFLGLTEYIKGRILYVVPKYAVQENIMAYGDFSSVKDKVDFVTYNQFTDGPSAEKLLDGHELIVIDECHHLGSDLYGMILARAMCSDETDRLYLGLTATPVRYRMNTTMPDGSVKKGVDVSLFFEKTINGISTFDAIRMGLMPPFQYRLMIPDKDPKQVEKEYDHQVNVVVNYEDSDDVMRNILRTFPRDKWIVFFPSVKELKRNTPKIKALFPGYKTFYLYSSLKNLKEVLDGVQASEKAVILSVNMLLEGVHLSGITGIALYRNVTTIGTFQQMLGRVCSIGNTVQPLIVDCSGCGPRLLRLLIADSQKNDAGNSSSGGNSKPIMSIGIGSHRKWESIDEFLKRTAKAETRAVTPGTIRTILSDYFTLGGAEYGSKCDIRKRDRNILTSVCWKYDVPVEKFYGQAPGIQKRLIDPKNWEIHLYEH